MKEQEEWVRQLRERMAGYEAPVPDDLWAGIEAALAKQKAAKSAPVRRVPLWGRWAVAAAFAGLLVGNSYLMWMIGCENPEKQEASLSEEKGLGPLGALGALGPLGTLGSLEPLESLESLAPLAPQAYHPQFAQEQESAPAPEPESQPMSPPSQDASAAEQEPPSTQQTLPAQEKDMAILAELDRKIAEEGKRRSSGMAFSLYASNGFGSQQHSNGVLMSPSMLANYAYTRSGDREGEQVWLYNYGEHQKHYQPISFGLTVKIPISSVLSLSSGVAYTRLRSDFKDVVRGYALDQEQTLHYIGIPLSVQYLLWQWHGLSAYATAGGQVDFNIKAKYLNGGTEVDFSRDRTQWSLQGALGLQYDIIPQLGVYAEPGVKYYFDNGSHVRNFFKDKPTNFNLQLGLRLNL